MTPQKAYKKALSLGKRIPELETVISQDAFYSYWYARDVIKGRFILAEPNISKDVQCGYWYAIDVIKGRLPDFMHNQMIFSNDKYAKEYVEFIQ